MGALYSRWASVTTTSTFAVNISYFWQIAEQLYRENDRTSCMRFLLFPNLKRHDIRGKNTVTIDGVCCLDRVAAVRLTPTRR